MTGPPHLGPPPEVQAAMAEIFQIEDTRPFELFRLLKGTAHLLDVLRGEYRKDGPLSAARMRILVRLAVCERLGKREGVQPSELSEHLGVSRNTISALLNGLEEQGLIERHLHPTDRRQLQIRITEGGEAVVHRHAPEFAAFLGDLLLTPLTEEEQATLHALLEKLFLSLVVRAQQMGITVPGIARHGVEIKSEPEE